MISGPKLPAPKPVATMPDDKSPSVLAAGRQAREAAMRRGGRQSTILSMGGRGGFDSYSGSRTGSAA